MFVLCTPVLCNLATLLLDVSSLDETSAAAAGAPSCQAQSTIGATVFILVYHSTICFQHKRFHAAMCRETFFPGTGPQAIAPRDRISRSGEPLTPISLTLRPWPMPSWTLRPVTLPPTEKRRAASGNAHASGSACLQVAAWQRPAASSSARLQAASCKWQRPACAVAFLCFFFSFSGASHAVHTRFRCFSYSLLMSSNANTYSARMLVQNEERLSNYQAIYIIMGP